MFRRIQDALASTQIEYRQGDVIETAAEAHHPFDFISLSDVPSYFAPPIEQTYLQRIRAGLTKHGRVVVRYYLRKPERTDRKGLRDITSSFATPIQREKVGVYQIEVFERTDTA